ncbi:oligopeptide transporter, permease protein [Renibacterium salmoninarum ATCC 33209]|uniref:Oligopeptide transporter, permease protein n=1 Tax=Renibacterium salmoninarum (strain ATCC 33209 / DSM 20767 / JCM 11484 / NBRC 15589 / NCIMB 2235) TaxID=288705 RepID=A9WPE5_RENSM|nr:ABC transporter permease [Renibacterium salmoninarum]ABY22902.1 oligopeptide transporter, permease protein [Renibacterium salmoninarum ATCC 33209]
MLSYLVRRIITAALILLGVSFVVYLLTAASGDPLEALRTSQNPNKADLIKARSDLLHLDVPAPLRYFVWLKGAAGCLVPFANACDLGKNLQGQPVTEQLSQALVQTLSLVTTATLLAIIIGVTVGIITALRQYSALDYGVTFMTFLFFSLPIFWAAVLLKEFGAISFNTFLQDPQIPIGVILVVAVIFGLIGMAVARGAWKKRWIAFGGTAVVVALVLGYISLTGWLKTPGLGPVVIAASGVGIAFGITALTAGLKNRKALYSSLVVVVIGLICYYALQPLLSDATFLMVVILAIVAILVGVAVGYFFGGYDRAQNMRAAALTAFLVAALVLLDRFMQSWPQYYDQVRGRPIATIGASTPNFQGDFWTGGLDRFTHLILPTIALILISIASYTRYSRGSMLEIMNMDYIRTARAKGLSERTVVMRHAFRNALIPLATVVAFDIGGLIGGAVITESVFSFTGMGQMFAQGLLNVDPNPVMGFFVVVAATALVFNLLADLVYSALDPRVKVKS